MKGNATSFKAGKGIMIWIPKSIIRAENIIPGNLISFDITNPHPEQVLEKKRGLNFLKKKITIKDKH